MKFFEILGLVKVFQELLGKRTRFLEVFAPSRILTFDIPSDLKRLSSRKRISKALYRELRSFYIFSVFGGCTKCDTYLDCFFHKSSFPSNIQTFVSKPIIAAPAQH